MSALGREDYFATRRCLGQHDTLLGRLHGVFIFSCLPQFGGCERGNVVRARDNGFLDKRAYLEIHCLWPSDVIEAASVRRTRCRRAPEERTVVAGVHRPRVRREEFNM